VTVTAGVLDLYGFQAVYGGCAGLHPGTRTVLDHLFTFAGGDKMLDVLHAALNSTSGPPVGDNARPLLTALAVEFADTGTVPGRVRLVELTVEHLWRIDAGSAARAVTHLTGGSRVKVMTALIPQLRDTNGLARRADMIDFAGVYPADVPGLAVAQLRRDAAQVAAARLTAEQKPVLLQLVADRFDAPVSALIDAARELAPARRCR
jgi:hypothetical protein